MIDLSLIGLEAECSYYIADHLMTKRSRARLFYERQCLGLILNQMIATFARMLKNQPVTCINRPKDSLIKDYSEPNRNKTDGLKLFTRTKVIFESKIKPRYIYLTATYWRCGKKVPWLQGSWKSEIKLQLWYHATELCGKITIFSLLVWSLLNNDLHKKNVQFHVSFIPNHSVYLFISYKRNYQLGSDNCFLP